MHLVRRKLTAILWGGGYFVFLNISISVYVIHVTVVFTSGVILVPAALPGKRYVVFTEFTLHSPHVYKYLSSQFLFWKNSKNAERKRRDNAVNSGHYDIRAMHILCSDKLAKQILD